MTKEYNTFKDLCLNLSQHTHLHIPSPPTQKRRAAVAIILRWHTRKPTAIVHNNKKVTSLQGFFEQPWVKEDKSGHAEILFMQRAARVGDRWSGHVSFVGGKNDPGETDEQTATREVMEEIGLDLNNRGNYIPVGKLDEREIFSVREDKLLMILIPFVYLQIVPESPSFVLQESEVAAVQWVRLSFFLSAQIYPSKPIVEQLTIGHFKNKWLSLLMRLMIGSVTFPTIDLPTSNDVKTVFRLWGLTMGMTSDLVEFTNIPKNRLAFVQLTTAKPIFSRPDIGLLATFITRLTCMFGKNSKEMTSKYDFRIRSKWDKLYFKSIRKAIVVAVLLRAGFTSVIFALLVRKWF